MSSLDIVSDLPAYADWAPTPFDVKGLHAGDQADWKVSPISITRDSEHLALSNWNAQLRGLQKVDPDGEDHQENRYGHWGPGWFEIVIVRPGSRAAEALGEMLEALEDYPVLDEEDYSERRAEAQSDSWESYGYDEARIQLSNHYSDDVDLDDIDSGELGHLLMDSGEFDEEGYLRLNTSPSRNYLLRILTIRGVRVDDRPVSVTTPKGRVRGWSSRPVLSRAQLRRIFA